jgi:hypothetical protein
MLRSAEEFGEQELALIYIAKKLKESLALENVLTAANIDYMIETDTYVGGILFRSARVGAFFYVTPEIEASTRTLLAENGYKPYEALAT